MDLQLEGKVALVAAASKGFGKAIALQLAREGCHVVMCARTEATLQVAADEVRAVGSGEVHAVAADVSSPDDCRRFVQTAIENHGRVDILVTNTGGPAAGDHATTTEQQWRDGIDSTLLNVVRLCNEVIPHMKQAGSGRILNIASISAREPILGLLLSNALRPAIAGYAKTLALELAADNILVNTICPGLHLTDRLHHLAEVRAEKSGKSPGEELEAMAASIPLRRLGKAEELADLVTFLCSPRAGFITGQSLVADGGAYRGQ